MTDQFETADRAAEFTASAIDAVVAKLLGSNRAAGSRRLRRRAACRVVIKRNPEALDWFCEGSMTLANGIADWRDRWASR